MRTKPLIRGTWSNWHKTSAKQKHQYIGDNCHYATIKKGYRYVWHYYKYRSWLVKRRFDMSKAKLINPPTNWQKANILYNKRGK